MKIQKTKGGFTLIELLVVITIIGILATGATATYTSQIQKARDTTRISDLSAFKSAVEQIFQDAAEYPEAVNVVSTAADTAIKCDGSDATKFSLGCLMKMQYIAKLPKDPKSGQPGNGSALDYVYAVSNVDGVLRQQYEVSSGFENAGNVTGKAANDSGNDKNRFEVGTGISKVFTVTAAGLLAITGTESTAGAIPKDAKSCEGVSAAATVSTNADQSTPVVVKGDCGST